ncbi:hypothetical protein KIN20_033506 [Parelaphostrongylus tenuis]|uniref:Uncharacterized protein n=1 Tax=Parelaphostrongylus tenuis TaxID=148309 RepID=A0AAD5WIB2_PARTN|nr:hypothetical protein KIN20_033506 [Parelaphostrongylus tenuis]
MATTAKNSSLVSNFVNNDRSQVNQLGFATTSAYEESLSNGCKDAPKKVLRCPSYTGMSERGTSIHAISDCSCFYCSDRAFNDVFREEPMFNCSLVDLK